MTTSDKQLIELARKLNRRAFIKIYAMIDAAQTEEARQTLTQILNECYELTCETVY